MSKKFQIITGVSIFRDLVSSDVGLKVDANRVFVDKSLFIKEFLDSGSKVLLITRPRRWGKTLTLSMLQHFLSKEVEGLPTAGLFENLKIANYLNDPKYKKYQGTHPVIFITFKDLKGNTFEEIKQIIIERISNLYSDYEYILQALSNKEVFSFGQANLNKYKNKFTKIMNGEASNAELIGSMKFLSELLKKYYGKKVFILIDEYDNAINDSFDKPEILKNLTDFFSGLLGNCLKDNDENLEKGLITGILRVAKANIFSGLNNPTEETILDTRFSEYYGFTETEVNKLLEQTGISNQLEIKDWYNGYIIGNNTIYNPWSIMHCINNKGSLEPYWANSANPKIIEDLLINKSSRED